MSAPAENKKNDGAEAKVIVSPELSEPSSKTPEAKPSNGGNNGNGNGGLSAVEADRLASKFRPSWEPPPPTEAAAEPQPVTAAPEPSAPEAAPPESPAEPEDSIIVSPELQPDARSYEDQSATVVDDSPPSAMAAPAALSTAELEPVVLSTQSNRGIIFLGVGGLLGVIGIVAFVIWSSGAEEPVAAASGPQSTSAEEPTQAPSEPTPAPVEEEPAAQVAAQDEPVAEEAVEEEAVEEEEALVEEEEALVEEEPAEEEVVEEEPPAPEMHRLRISVEPRTAEVSLDGQEIELPFDEQVESSDAEHRIVASAEGYIEASRTIRYTRDRQIVLRLRRAPTPMRATMRPTMRATSRTMRTVATNRTMRQTMRNTMRANSGMRTMRGAGFVTTNPY